MEHCLLRKIHLLLFFEIIIFFSPNSAEPCHNLCTQSVRKKKKKKKRSCFSKAVSTGEENVFLVRCVPRVWQRVWGAKQPASQTDSLELLLMKLSKPKTPPLSDEFRVRVIRPSLSWPVWDHPSCKYGQVLNKRESTPAPFAFELQFLGNFSVSTRNPKCKRSRASKHFRAARRYTFLWCFIWNVRRDKRVMWDHCSAGSFPTDSLHIYTVSLCSNASKTDRSVLFFHCMQMMPCKIFVMYCLLSHPIVVSFDQLGPEQQVQSTHPVFTVICDHRWVQETTCPPQNPTNRLDPTDQTVSVYITHWWVWAKSYSVKRRGWGGSSEVFHDANKIIWQRSQTPELFALKTEWRQGTGGVVMTFWGMSPETVGRAEAFGRGKKKSTICVFDPASVDVLWESVPGECQVCTEKTVHRGGRWFVRLGPCVIYCEALGKKTLGLQWLGRASAHCSFWFRRTKKQRKNRNNCPTFCS